jgi:hypothetical protein
MRAVGSWVALAHALIIVPRLTPPRVDLLSLALPVHPDGRERRPRACRAWRSGEKLTST